MTPTFSARYFTLNLNCANFIFLMFSFISMVSGSTDPLPMNQLTVQQINPAMNIANQPTTYTCQLNLPEYENQPNMPKLLFAFAYNINVFNHSTHLNLFFIQERVLDWPGTNHRKPTPLVYGISNVNIPIFLVKEMSGIYHLLDQTDKHHCKSGLQNCNLFLRFQSFFFVTHF